ncbi:MAG: hypothetical protein HYV97_04520 [Bdellovibrio sp.]|nr:hypothetical protein [Bdellovibrio sp.]
MKLFCALVYCLSMMLGLASNAQELDSVPFFFKTRTESITDKFYFKIENGMIYVNRVGQRSWVLFDDTGVPTEDDKALTRDIVEISADGENLIAIDSSGQVFYTKVAKVKWHKKWGKPLPKVLHLEDNLAWGISHRGPYMEYYNDIHGNPHPIFAGVTTLYLLRKNGHEIVYVDPWIPADWWHQVDLPFRGRMMARNMSVSASTLFIINNVGEMYTRLYDYDTSGQNPILPYSYKNDVREGTRKIIRSLPAPDWQLQPAVKGGMITEKITILQTGEKGNGAFELRVEGINGQGMTGYFRKKIYDSDWEFVATGQQIIGKFLKSEVERELAPPKTKNYVGKIWLKKQQLSMELLDCSPLISPATLRLKVADESFDFKFHMRRYKYEKKGMAFKATLEISQQFIQSQNPNVQKIWKEFFRQEQFIDFHTSIKDKKLESKENLHQFGIDKVADVLTWKLGYRFSKVHLKAKYHRRLRMSVSEI